MVSRVSLVSLVDLVDLVWFVNTVRIVNSSLSLLDLLGSLGPAVFIFTKTPLAGIGFEITGYRKSQNLPLIGMLSKLKKSSNPFKERKILFYRHTNDFHVVLDNKKT